MQRITHPNGTVTFTFDGFADQAVRAHVSTRHGGVSPSPWASLNFSVSRGDDPERVQANFGRFCATLSIDPSYPVRTHQVHGTAVAKVDRDDAGRRHKVDALITDSHDLPLFLVFADCVPLILYDPHTHALGACHAGWRGTVNGAAAATLWAMQAAYGVNPQDVLVGIGPSIGPDSYEVGGEVFDLARAKLSDAERFFRFSEVSDKPFFDLWQANADQLVEAGVPAEQIEIAGIDTAQSTHDFYSHRAEEGRCGLFGIMTWLLPR